MVFPRIRAGQHPEKPSQLVAMLVQGQPNLLAQEFIMLSLIATLQTFGVKLTNRLYDEKGATAVEYGIMVALIAVVIIVAVSTLGGQLNTMFTGVTASL